MIRSGDTIIVTDAADQYHGQEGYVTGFEVGMISGREMAIVQLDGRPGWDIEAFYLPQIELAQDADVVPLHRHSVRVVA